MKPIALDYLEQTAGRMATLWTVDGQGNDDSEHHSSANRVGRIERALEYLR